MPRSGWTYGWKWVIFSSLLRHYFPCLTISEPRKVTTTLMENQHITKHTREQEEGSAALWPKGKWVLNLPQACNKNIYTTTKSGSPPADSNRCETVVLGPPYSFTHNCLSLSLVCGCVSFLPQGLIYSYEMWKKCRRESKRKGRNHWNWGHFSFPWWATRWQIKAKSNTNYVITNLLF